MKSFLDQVIEQLQLKGNDVTQLSYVVPSRRAGIFLGRAIATTINKPILQPQIQSIEEFIESQSGIRILSDIDILPTFYISYKKLLGDQAESYEKFLGWAPTILRDFNEIDRQLVDPDQLFDYWSSIKELDDSVKHWSEEQNQTVLVSDYLKFWNDLKPLYVNLKSECNIQGIGYSGLGYRIAYNKISSGDNNLNAKTIFLGFNALNKAEESIMLCLLKKRNADIYWDTDEYFLNHHYHEAGKFIRNYQTSWGYYRDNPINIVGKSYTEQKQISIHSVSGNIAMTHVAVNLIKEIPIEQLDKTAIILADENLLLPLLSVLPESIGKVNVTLSLSLDKLPAASFFRDLIQLFINYSEKGFYYKDLLTVLDSSFSGNLFSKSARKVSDLIRNKNLVYVQHDVLKENFNSELSKLFTEKLKDATCLVKRVETIIELCKDNLLNKKQAQLELEQLFGIKNVIDKIVQVLSKIPQEESRLIAQLYNQLLPLEKLSFIGEPVQGLQIMGILESRALDFENIIMLSVNEGALPAGKSNSSFIPFEIRLTYHLPTYRDRDSIYAYHFYRLLQRSNKVDLIYNSEQQALGSSEQSRFISQITSSNDTEQIIKTFQYASPALEQGNNLITIPKTEPCFERLNELAKYGFSPSTLTSYIRNPLEFCTRKIFKVENIDAVEEDMALNTMGTIIHDSLEQLYLPLLNRVLSLQDFQQVREKIDPELKKAYLKSYPFEENPTGQNKIIYEVSRHYLNKMISMDMTTLREGNELIILDLESKLTGCISLEHIGTIQLRGTVDRIDSLNGNIRIIDYKTGKVEKSHVGIEPDGYEVLLQDYDKSKAFQVLMYAYLYRKSYPDRKIDEAGIISFKNFEAGFIPFSIRSGRSFKGVCINDSIMDSFEYELGSLLKEIFDPEIAIEEKEI